MAKEITSQNIGKKVRELRKEKNMTLKQLSTATDLSIGYLSNLERDAASPTLDNIQKICGVLETSLTELLEDKSDSRMIVRKNERTITFERENTVRYESIAFGENMMEALCITLEAHTRFDTSNWIHPYDEMGLVVEGALDIRIGESHFHLEEGDAFYIKARTNHSLGNTSDKRCVSYWFSNPTWQL